MTNISILEVNILKNSSILAVSVTMNVSFKLGFVSVNGPRESYFVDALHTKIVDPVVESHEIIESFSHPSRSLNG